MFNDGSFICFFLHEPRFPVCLRTFAPADEDLIIFATGGRHRPQRCRQTDLRAGEAVVHVQAASSGTAKDQRGRPVATYQLPVHQEGQILSFLP
jgi:hypothetical protein